VVVLAALSGCADHGVRMVTEGREPVQLPSDSDQLPTGSVNFFTLSPLDALQGYVLPRTMVDPNASLDFGSRVRVGLEYVGNDYAIMPGDKLSIRSDAEPDKVLGAVVRPDGDIALPQISAEVHVAGQTPRKAASMIERRYAGIMIAPKINVAVEQSALEDMLKISGDYTVNRDGQIVMPMLGAFKAAGRSPGDLAGDVSRAASAKFGNPIKAVTSPAQVSGREADPRIDPDGQQYFRGSVKISPDGTVFLPEAGPVPAAGRTLEQLRDDITKRLQPRYHNPIDVSVTLLDSGNLNVFIGGQVRLPGRYPYMQSMTVLQLLSAAGWIDEWGDLGDAVVMHPVEQGRYVLYRTNLDDAISGRSFQADLKLAPRDIVIIPRTGIAKVDLWIDQYIRKFLPINLNAGYSYGQGTYTTTVHP
jgi:protein involved in polysaccharide export with SLBB domain